MIKNSSVEASIEKVLAELRELAHSGLKGSVTAHFDGKRYVKVDRITIKPIEDLGAIP